MAPTATPRATTIQWIGLIAIISWTLIAVTGWPLLRAGITADGAAGAAVRWTIALVWGVTLIALVIPSVMSLTLARVITPLAATAAVIFWWTTSDTTNGAITSAATATAAIIVGTGEFGQRSVQASAYGDEQRFPLRAPSAFLVASVIAWLLTAVAVIVAIGMLGDNNVVSTVVGLVAVALVVLGAPRWHRLSRRWLVLVPAGVVVHDPLVLSETAMWRRHHIAGASLATSDTSAADLTGPASGHLIEVRLSETATVVLTDGRANPRGRAIHLTAGLIAPSRPGAAIAAMRQRGIGP
jgi:hypothetical protein